MKQDIKLGWTKSGRNYKALKGAYEIVNSKNGWEVFFDWNQHVGSTNDLVKAQAMASKHFAGNKKAQRYALADAKQFLAN